MIFNLLLSPRFVSPALSHLCPSSPVPHVDRDCVDHQGGGHGEAAQVLRQHWPCHPWVRLPPWFLQVWLRNFFGPWLRWHQVICYAPGNLSYESSTTFGIAFKTTVRVNNLRIMERNLGKKCDRRYFWADMNTNSAFLHKATKSQVGPAQRIYLTIHIAPTQHTPGAQVHEDETWTLHNGESRVFLVYVIWQESKTWKEISSADLQIIFSIFFSGLYTRGREALVTSTFLGSGRGQWKGWHGSPLISVKVRPRGFSVEKWCKWKIIL